MLGCAFMLSIVALTSLDSGATMPSASAVSIASRTEEAMRRLDSEPPAIIQTYEMLAAKPKPDRVGAYNELPSSMKASMWTHQLLRAVADHPEFTDEQRGLIYDALDLFTPDFFDLTQTDPSWSTRVGGPLRRIEQRGKAIFGPVLGGQLFAQLGPENPTPPSQPVGPVPRDAVKGVEETYRELLALKARDRSQSYRQLSSRMKADIWAHHLLSSLAQHPEYTREQRDVIQYALSLVSPGFFELEPSSPNWREVVDRPLQQLTHRAKAVFEPTAARELFVQLGPNAAVNSGSPANDALHFKILHPRPLDVVVVPTCECASQSDWCNDNPTYYPPVYSSCRPGFCWASTSGCGTFFRYPCDGMCVALGGGGDG